MSRQPHAAYPPTRAEPPADLRARSGASSPAASSTRQWVEDRLIRLIFVPILGLGIPNAAGLYGSLGPSSTLYWVGSAWFVLISFTIWHGNRAYHRRMRSQPDWVSRPVQRVFLLLGASLVLTGPYSGGMLWLWYRMAGMPTDWSAIRSATLLIVVCTMFIMHTYETVYLIRQRSRDQVAVEKLARAKAQAELAVLKGQIDPHFMFNSLNTLAGLIEEDADRASEFTVAMAEVYRYILHGKDHELVPLDWELDFVRNYYSLLKLRFDDAIALHLPELSDGERCWVLPVSLQLLIENAVKHNEFSERSPLFVHVQLVEGELVVRNDRRPPLKPKATSRLGLQNLDERCRLVLGKPVHVIDDGVSFTVRLPVKTEEPSDLREFA